MSRRADGVPWSGAALSIGLLAAAVAVSVLAWRGYFSPAVVVHLLGLSSLGC